MSGERERCSAGTLSSTPFGERGSRSPTCIMVGGEGEFCANMGHGRLQQNVLSWRLYYPRQPLRGGVGSLGLTATIFLGSPSSDLCLRWKVGVGGVGPAKPLGI